MPVKRYDVGDLGPMRMDNGYLRTTGKLTRVGIFDYLRADGSIQKELRPAEEVFKTDSIASFGLVPLTNGHPPEALTSSNTRRWQTGTISEPKQDGDFMVADIQVTDEKTIDDAKAGKSELSNGYLCDFEETPGVHPQFGRYDGIQRNIRGNHVALVPRARGGRDLTIRLDGDDARMIPDGHTPPTPQPGPSPRSDSKMKTIRIDGVDYEVSEPVMQAVSKLQARADGAGEQIETLTAEVSTEKARADKAGEDLEAEKTARADESSDEAIQKRVDARVSLQVEASKILGEKNDAGEEWKLDSMSDAEIQTAVVLKVSPTAQEKLDAGDAAYLHARFDQAVEGHAEAPAKKETRTDGLHGVRHASSVVAPDKDRKDAESARTRMLVENYAQGRKPLTGGVHLG